MAIATAEEIKQGGLPQPASRLLIEKGTTGLNEWGGYIGEEFLAELQGKRGYEKYREMRLNSAMVGAILFAIEQMLLSAEVQVEPGEGPQAEEATEYVEQCLDDMEFTWRSTMSEILSFLPYGYSLMEIVLKKRNGNTPGIGEDGWPLPTSEYDDGKFGWAKFGIRGQETVDKWMFNPHGGMVGIVQRDPMRTDKDVFIPRSTFLHFKTTSTQGNPEGQSILRIGYKSYFYATRIEEIEAIGIERNLNGLPVLTPAESVDLFKTDAKTTNFLRYAKQVITGIRRDSNMGVVKPFGWVLELLRAGGEPTDVSKVIDRYNWSIARSVLAQFLEQGRQQTGSYASKVSDTQLFLEACKGWHGMIADEIQMRAVVPLVTVYNQFSLTKAPRIRFSDITQRDFAAVATAIEQLTNTDWLRPTDAGRKVVATQMSLPEPTDEEIAEQEAAAEDDREAAQAAREEQAARLAGIEPNEGNAAPQAAPGAPTPAAKSRWSVNDVITGAQT